MRLCELLGNLRSIAARKGLDFDYLPALTDSDYYNLAGLKKDHFNSVANCIKKHIKSTSGRSYRTCLALLLTKLRTGLSISVLSTLFALSKRRAGRAIAAARVALMSYIYRKKFELSIRFQRQTYSVHKGRPLVKPMIIVSFTGYIVTIFGPYFADGKNNDANILTTLMRSDASELRSYLKPNDVFVVDRGFRDCLKLLEDLGFIIKMLHFLKDGSQHTSSEANESRLVTKIRWIIEAVNGLLKK
ncbi:hypothetical protein ALC57_01669 [Trachymyrmex cornetzi]|uniref:DDE Tnp4 domain-containing protein n=1 Tax=Trachymyrmex cornetzi TaxID=471704 RepID=A0A151JPJ0_9HYME|nr:hypothetical protein ALC57_01669 [Trachymyrmex cornetzi]